GYGRRFAVPIRHEVRVDRVSGHGGAFVVHAGNLRIEAENVIVATGANREPRMPVLADQLDPAIVQLHSGEYRRPSQLREGGVLIVGAGNSGADIAMELVRERPTWLWPGHRARARSDRNGLRPTRGLPDRPIRGAPRSNDPNADRTQGSAEVHVARGTARARQAEGPLRGRTSSGSRERSASEEGLPSSRTTASSRSPTSSGAPASDMTCRGSTSPSSGGWRTGSRARCGDR